MKRVYALVKTNHYADWDIVGVYTNEVAAYLNRLSCQLKAESGEKYDPDDVFVIQRTEFFE